MTTDPIENLEFQIDELRNIRDELKHQGEVDLVVLTRIDTIVANLHAILLDMRNQRVSLKGGHYA